MREIYIIWTITLTKFPTYSPYALRPRSYGLTSIYKQVGHCSWQKSMFVEDTPPTQAQGCTKIKVEIKWVVYLTAWGVSTSTTTSRTFVVRGEWCDSCMGGYGDLGLYSSMRFEFGPAPLRQRWIRDSRDSISSFADVHRDLSIETSWDPTRPDQFETLTSWDTSHKTFQVQAKENSYYIKN